MPLRCGFKHGSTTGIVQYGYWDYNDATTTATPISITGDSAWNKLPNDGLGPQTLDTYAYPGVDDVWDTSLSQFDFSGLTEGDICRLRIDLSVDTGGNNCDVGVALRFGIGSASEYMRTVTHEYYKNQDEYSIDVEHEFYLGPAVKAGPCEVHLKSDVNLDLTVNGWYFRVFPRIALGTST